MAWKRLSVPERDVVTVLGALCKLAARDSTSQDAKEVYLQQGKLLALEMLAACIVRFIASLLSPQLAMLTSSPLSSAASF